MAEALSVNATHLMFVDTDVTFPPDGISKLLAAQKDIIGGIYNMKHLPRQSTLKMLAKDGTYIDGDVAIPSVPFKAGVVPSGFMMIDLQRLTGALAAPFFTFAERDGEMVGEDVNFCERARDAGLEVWADPRVAVGHVGDFIY